MTVPTGSQIGGLEIGHLLGAGGMGEVYLARDPQLHRSVAVKVLRDEVTREPHRLARFEQEARAASALSHPNICHIYHLGETPDRGRYIAMELVEGETLDERLGAGRLPLRDALDIAVQIAAALTAAHGAGIVHRDIKPANVMIRRDRLVKVLDFGLAKLLPSVTPSTRHESTQTALSESGSLVGTVQYMAPEQARGHAVDARTDIWALGVVLYEMVAGHPPFAGSNRSDLLVAILDREPEPLARVDPRLPPELQRIVLKALRKDPEQRYQTMKDLLLDLQVLRDELTSAERNRASDARVSLHAVPDERPVQHTAPPAAGASAARPHPFVTRAGRLLAPARVAAALTMLGLGVLAGWWITSRPAGRGGTYTLDLMLDGFEMDADTAPMLSPDGRALVYRARGRLWHRALHEFTSKPLPDTTGAVYPFWSPDSRQVAFVRDRKIWRLPIEGSGAIPVGNAPEGLSGTGSGVWTESGDLIIAGSDSVGLFSISVHDGKVRELLGLDKRHETDFHQVAALPERRGLLIAVHRLQGSDTIAALVDGRRQDVLQLPGETIQAPVYAPPGYLLFERRTTSDGIWAIRFSLDRLAAAGAPFLVVPDALGPTVGADDTLAFVRGWPPPSQLVWIDRKGSIEPIGELPGVLGPGSAPALALSPDESRVAVSLYGALGPELWSFDLTRRNVTRLSAGATRVTHPVWTPDGRGVLFGGFGRGRFWNVYSVSASDARPPTRVLAESAAYQWPCTISPDGRWLVYAEALPDGSADLWIAPQDGADAAQPLMKTPFREDYAKFSPDGRSFVYVSNESGRPEVYVRAFPVSPERVQVSTNGGSMPMWGPDGRRIFYRTPDALMEATFARTPARLSVSAPEQLFRIDSESRLHEPFAVASDGRFLFGRALGGARVSVMLNWSRGVSQLEGAR